jgi:transcriptional regulator GlxA family with amidase domain
MALPFVPVENQRKRDLFVRLCQARTLLCNVDGRPMPVAEVARAVALSPYQFIRMFKACFGETPHQVRIAARLTKAQQLLAGSQYSVTEICAAVGFSSLGTFSFEFARRTGSPPSTYRRRSRALRSSGTAAGPEPAPGCFALMSGWPT